MRGFCSRVLGWTTDREVVVKQAIRSIDLAATHQAALVLCGDGDLVQVARGVHRHALGDAEVHARIIVKDEEQFRRPWRGGRV